MSDYIRRQDAIELCNNPLSEQSMRLVPPADVAPVVYGRWIKEYRAKGQVANMCTECGGETGRVSKYCPNCGAKMDGEEWAGWMTET